MDVGRFDKPVRVMVEQRGNIAGSVTTTAQAADILLHRWPGDPGAKKHLAARKACITVLEGLTDAQAARLASKPPPQRPTSWRPTKRSFRPVKAANSGTSAPVS